MSLHCTAIMSFHSRMNITDNDCFFVSGYLVEIYFVGSRILLGDIGDPSRSAKSFTKYGSESQIKICFLANFLMEVCLKIETP